MRPLREIKIIVFCFSRKDRRERKVLFTFRIPRLRWRGRKLRYDKSAQRVLSTPSALRAPSGSSVALGCAPLMRHKMTLSHFSQDLIRPLSQRDRVSGNIIATQIAPRGRVSQEDGASLD